MILKLIQSFTGEWGAQASLWTNAVVPMWLRTLRARWIGRAAGRKAQRERLERMTYKPRVDCGD